MTCYIIKYTIEPENLKETLHYKNITVYIANEALYTVILLTCSWNTLYMHTDTYTQALVIYYSKQRLL